MALDDASKQKVQAWIDQHKTECTVCHGKAWSILDLVGSLIFETPTRKPRGPFGTGKHYVFEVPIICEGCGLTLRLPGAKFVDHLDIVM